MARKQAIPFIPTQPVIAKVDRTSQQIGALLGSVASIAQIGIQTQLNAQTEANERSAALLKVRQLGLDEKAKASKLEQQEAIRDSQRTEQAVTQAQRSFDIASAEIERTEKMGIFGVVNGMTESQLQTANAKGLGFTTPSAVLLADQAIGERQANLDFPRLLDAIASDESKLPSDHLRKFLSGRDLKNDTASLYYANLLTNNLKSFERSAILSRAKKTRSVAFQNNIDNFQFKVVQDFDILDKETFATHLGSMFVGLKEANPNLSDTEFRSIAVETLKPLFVGSEARFGAASGLLKLSEIFTTDEAEAFGLGGIVTQLRAQVKKDINTNQAGTYSQFNDLVSASQDHDQLRELRSATQGQLQSGGLSPTKGRLLLSNIDSKLQGPDRAGEFRDFIAGDTTIPMTAPHDPFIDQSADELKLQGRARASYMLQTFGRVTDSFIGSINNLYNSADVAGSTPEFRTQRVGEAVKRFNDIAEASPLYARNLLADKKIDGGLAAIAQLASVPGQSLENVVATYGQIPTGNINSIIATVNSDSFGEDSGLGSFTSMYAKALGDSDIEPNAEVGRFFKSMMALSIAEQSNRGGKLDIATASEIGKDFATRMTNQAFSTVTFGGREKIFGDGFKGGTSHSVHSSTAAQLGWNQEAIRNGHNNIFIEWRTEILREFPAIDSLNLVPDKAQIGFAEDGVTPIARIPVVANDIFRPLGTNADLVFEVPLRESDIKAILDGQKVHPFNDPNRAFNSGSDFPGIGKFLYGTPEDSDK